LRGAFDNLLFLIPTADLSTSLSALKTLKLVLKFFIIVRPAECDQYSIELMILQSLVNNIQTSLKRALILSGVEIGFCTEFSVA